MRVRAPTIGAVLESQGLSKTKRMQVHLPAGGRMSERRFLENLGKAFAPELHLPACPCGVRIADTVLPSGVIPAMQSELEVFVTHVEHHIVFGLCDVDTGGQCAHTYDSLTVL